MPYVKFDVNNGEMRFVGAARYTTSRGSTGDSITPPEPAGVDLVQVTFVDEVYEFEAGEWRLRTPSYHIERRKLLDQSVWCLEQIEEVCYRDFEKARQFRDVNS